VGVIYHDANLFNARDKKKNYENTPFDIPFTDNKKLL
jgi:hypothetical protein